MARYSMVKVEMKKIEAAIEKGEEMSHLDWTKFGIVADVRDQMGCQCCWAIVAADILSSISSKKKGYLISYSPQQLLDCVDPTNKNQDSLCCYMLTIDKAFKWIMKYGISLEQDYPFVAERTTSNKEIPRHFVMNAYKRIADGDPSQQELLQVVKQHPVAAVMDVFEDFLNIKDEIYSGPKSSLAEYYGLHAVQIIGYDSKGDKPYFYVQSSWGKKWGVNGVAKVDRTVMIKHSESKGKFRNLVFRASYPILIDDSSQGSSSSYESS